SKMYIDESEVRGQPLIDAIEPEDPWSFEITARIEIAVLVEGTSRDGRSRHPPDSRIVAKRPDHRLDHQPFPNEVRRCVAMLSIVLQILGHHRANSHRGEEPNPLH